MTMTEQEIAKLEDYKAKCKTCYNSNARCLPHSLSYEIQQFIEELICKYNWSITARDTHRWVDSDGWYEVEFTLYTEVGEVYVNTEHGDRELEDLWSSDNPQEVNLYDCYLNDLSWDWCCFLTNLISVYKVEV